GVIATDPTARGILTDSAGRPNQMKSGSSLNLFRTKRFGADLAASQRMRAIAGDAGKSLTQLAQAWVLSQPGDGLSIEVAPRASALRDQLGALEWTIPEAIALRIDDTLSERDRQLDR